MAVEYGRFAQNSGFDMTKAMNAANLGLKIRAIKQQNAQRQQALDDQNALNTYYASERTPEDYDTLAKSGPRVIATFKQNYDNMATVRQDTMRKNARELRAALTLGDKAVAHTLLDRRIEAAKGSGDQGKIKLLESMKGMVDEQSDKLMGMADFTLSTILSPKEAGKHLLGVTSEGSETWTEMSLEDKKKKGYKASDVVQESSSGKIMINRAPIGSGSETWTEMSLEDKKKKGYKASDVVQESSSGKIMINRAPIGSGSETWTEMSLEDKKKKGYKASDVVQESSSGKIMINRAPIGSGSETWTEMSLEDKKKKGYKASDVVQESSSGKIQISRAPAATVVPETWQPATLEEKKSAGFTKDAFVLKSSRGDYKLGRDIEEAPDPVEMAEGIKKLQGMDLNQEQIEKVLGLSDGGKNKDILDLVAYMEKSRGKITDPNKRSALEVKMQKQYASLTRVFTEVKAAVERIRTVDPNVKSGAQDIALLTSFMKLLDPGSVVRESEYAIAQRSQGAMEEAKTILQGDRIMTGDALSPTGRVRYMKLAEKLYEAASIQEQDVRTTMQKAALDYGLKSERIFYGEGGAKKYLFPYNDDATRKVTAANKKRYTE